MECSISGGVAGAGGKGKYHLPALLSECTIQMQSEKNNAVLLSSWSHSLPVPKYTFLS